MKINNLNNEIKRKLLIENLLVGFIIFLSVLAGVISYLFFKEFFYKYTDSKLYSAAMNANEFVLGEKFYKKALSDTLHKECDKNYSLKLTRFAKNAGVTYIYSMIDKNNSVYFLASSLTQKDIKNGDIYAYMQKYPEATETLKNVFKNGKIAFEESKDRWGYFRSILIPIDSKYGRYVIGADLKISDIKKSFDEYKIKLFLILGLVDIFALMIAFFYYRLVKEEKKHLEEICSLNEKLEEMNKNLEKRVKEESEKRIKQEELILRESKYIQMGEMMDAVAHQWKVPLSAIMLESGLLKMIIEKKGCIDDEIEKSINNIQEYVNHLNETLDNFRNFVNTKNYEKFLISEVVESVKNLVKDLLIINNVRLETQIKNFKIYGRKNDFEHILLSLIDNSIKIFNQRNINERVIKIKAKDYEIIYEDNAGGFEGDIEKIFDFNYSKTGGSGIGLYIVKMILDKYGGDIKAQNIKNGIRFIINLKKFRYNSNSKKIKE